MAARRNATLTVRRAPETARPERLFDARVPGRRNPSQCLSQARETEFCRFVTRAHTCTGTRGP